MSNPLILVDPITYKVTEIDDANPWENYTHKFLEKVVERIKNQIKGKSDLEKLKIANDEIAGLLNSDDCEWARIPSDTKFPGFFSSLADHALATSAVGVAIAVECWNKKIEFAREYAGKQVSEFLKNKLSVIQVVRLLCLLHDSGKPSFNHEEQTRKATEDFLTHLGFGGFASEMAEIASKHHYGAKAKHPPETKLEWIIAYADRVAVSDRTFTHKILLEERQGIRVAPQPLKWLAQHVGPEDVEKAQQLAVSLDQLDERLVIPYDSPMWKNLKEIVPLDYDHLKNLDSELLKASEKLLGKSDKDEIKLALVLLEGAGIQGYVTKSSAARHLVGRSSLVEVATLLAKAEIEEMLAPESIIYVASGSIFALVPPSELSGILQKSNEKFEEAVRGGTTLKGCGVAENCSSSLFDLKNGPEYAWVDWKKNASLPIVGKRNFGEFYTILNNTIEPLSNGAKGDVRKELSVNDICSVCFEEEALPKEDAEVIETRQGLPEDEREGYNPGAVCLNVDQHRANLRTNLQKSLRIEFNDKVTVEAPERLESLGDRIKSMVENSPKYRVLRKVRDLLESILKEEKHKGLVTRLGGTKVEFASITTWDDLGRQSKDTVKRGHSVGDDEEKEEREIHDVAFVRGDGDDFGKIKSGMSNITLYRKVSKIFEDVIQNSMIRALAEVMVAQLDIQTRERESPSGGSDSTIGSLALDMPFEVVYHGGDEFMLVLDAGFTLAFLNSFREAIVQRLGPRKKNYEKKEDENLSIFPLGVSVSVVVAPNMAPAHGTLSALRELEEKAKAVSRRRRSSTSGLPFFGADICVAFQRFTAMPSKEFVDTLYEGKKPLGGNIKVIETGWPRLGSEIFDDLDSGRKDLPLVTLTRMLLQNKLLANDVSESVRTSSSEAEAKLWIKYKAARMGEERSEKKGYKLLAKHLIIPREAPTNTEDENEEKGHEVSIRFQHRDIADIMKIIYNELLLLPGGSR